MHGVTKLSPFPSSLATALCFESRFVWKILFGEVCGYDVENLSDKLKKLAEFYGVKGKPHPGQLLFALHTYYALLIKLLAAEIVSFFNPWMTRQVEKLQNATTSAKLRRELDELERGGIFHTGQA